MNAGIVLKVNHSSVVVLTDEGQYIKCKKQKSSYTIGQEIQFPHHSIIENNKIKTIMPKLLPVMIASALIFISFIFVDKNNQSVQAAGIVNVNSQAKVSIVLNKKLKVIGLKGKNDEGKKLIYQMDDWKQESLENVMNDLIDKMEKNKVIEPNEKVIVSGSMEKKYKDTQVKLNKQLDNIRENNSHVNLNKSTKINKSNQQQIKPVLNNVQTNKSRPSIHKQSSGVNVQKVTTSTIQNKSQKGNIASKVTKDKTRYGQSNDDKRNHWKKNDCKNKRVKGKIYGQNRRGNGGHKRVNKNQSNQDDDHNYDRKSGFYSNHLPKIEHREANKNVKKNHSNTERNNQKNNHQNRRNKQSVEH